MQRRGDWEERGCAWPGCWERNRGVREVGRAHACEAFLDALDGGTQRNWPHSFDPSQWAQSPRTILRNGFDCEAVNLWQYWHLQVQSSPQPRAHTWQKTSRDCNAAYLLSWVRLGRCMPYPERHDGDLENGELHGLWHIINQVRPVENPPQPHKEWAPLRDVKARGLSIRS